MFLKGRCLRFAISSILIALKFESGFTEGFFVKDTERIIPQNGFSLHYSSIYRNYKANHSY